MDKDAIMPEGRAIGSNTVNTATLNLTIEQALWINDILTDYTLMLKWAEWFYSDEKTRLEALIKAGETPEAVDAATQWLDALNKDKVNVDIAVMRHKILSEAVKNFLPTPTPNVETVNTDAIEWVSVWADEQVHPVDETGEVI